MTTWLEAIRGIGIVIGALVAAIAFTRKVWLPAYRARVGRREAYRALPGLLQGHIHAFDAFRDEVTHEIRPNNGSSLKDSLARIEVTGTNLRDSVQLLQGMIRHRADGDGHHGVIECDNAGLVEWSNATLLRWTAMQAPLLLGWGWVNTIAHIDRARIRDEWEDAIVEGRDFTSTFGLITPDGVLPCEIKATPLRDSRGHILKWLWTITRMATAAP